jgi:hypothetical protein
MQDPRHILLAQVALPAEAMLRKALIRAAKTLILPHGGVPLNIRNLSCHKPKDYLKNMLTKH